MPDICPKCGNQTLDSNSKCSNCGYKKITYKKKNIQSANALARKAALEKKEQTKQSIESNKETLNRTNISKPPTVESKKTEHKEATIKIEKPINSTNDTPSKTIEKPKDQDADIETEMKTKSVFSIDFIVNLIKKRVLYNFSKERKIEKRINLDIDLNFDKYYDDVEGIEKCVSEGIEPLQVFKVSSSILSFILVLIFLINWL